MDELTARQQAILDFVSAQVEAEGLPPTLAEIAHAFGFNQTRGAHKHLLALEAKGHLTLLPGKARGIRLHGRNAYAGTRLKQRADSLELPVLGRVAAGAPIGAGGELEPERHLLLDRAMFFPTPVYALKVKGDSMIEDGILDGDFIVVESRQSADNGQTVVALVDGSDATVKRFYRERSGVRLEPANPRFKPIHIKPSDRLSIQGVVIGVIRKYNGAAKA